MEKTLLGREDAPLSAETWKLLDATMIEAAKSQLSGRRIISIEGPYGFGLKAIPLSDCECGEGISGSPFIPVSLITTSFFLNKRDLAATERDGLMFDAAPVAGAAMACAAKEESIIYNGLQDVPGLLNAEGGSSLTLTKWDKTGTAADQIIDAVTKLDDAGFHGPYCMALAPAQYNLLLRRYPQGDGTELDHVRRSCTWETRDTNASAAATPPSHRGRPSPQPIPERRNVRPCTPSLPAVPTDAAAGQCTVRRFPTRVAVPWRLTPTRMR